MMSPENPAPQPTGTAHRAVDRADSGPSYDELRHFFEGSGDLLCIADFTGRFKCVNPAWQRALGWTPEDLQARPFLEFVHPDDHPATQAEMAKLIHGGTTITFENRYQCRDGSWRWLQWTAEPQPDLQEVYAIARDITRRKRLEEEILRTLDRERERMGRELHDGLCQDLAGIAALSTTLALKLAATAATESAAAREISALLRQSFQHTRDLARGENPAHLQAIGLVAALRDLCSNTAARFKIGCTFQHVDILPALALAVKAHLYRIAKEAVGNAVAHAKGQHITVSLGGRDGTGTLMIEDDGVGTPLPPADGHPGIGLHTMAYRARQIGATFAMGPRLPQGTSVTCRFPLPPATTSP